VTDREPVKVYLATAGEYSDYRVRHAFSRREDAEAYQLGDDVAEFEVHDGPVEVRNWHYLHWNPALPDREASWPTSANPYLESELRDFDGDERNVQHEWVEFPGRKWLRVSGWDRRRVLKVYSEQRGQYLANLALAAGPPEGTGT